LFLPMGDAINPKNTGWFYYESKRDQPKINLETSLWDYHTP